IEFFYTQFKEMIELFAMPYINDHFDFSETAFFDKLYKFGERLKKLPEFKQARGVKHFIYINRTNFGLYNILHELKAEVKTDTYKPHVVLEY
ncbi:MAG: AarF/ABC1/UbiB kinase family protein, partial [Mucilaginibacter sp.]